MQFFQKQHISKLVSHTPKVGISAEKLLVVKKEHHLSFLKIPRSLFLNFFLRKLELNFVIFQERKSKMMKIEKLSLKPVGHPYACWAQLFQLKDGIVL